MDFSEFVHTGPETLAGRFLRRSGNRSVVPMSLAPVRRCRFASWARILRSIAATAARPHLVGSRCAHRGTQLSVGLDRRRLHSLFLSRLEIRRHGPMRRAAGGGDSLCGKDAHSQLSRERIHRTDLRLSGRRRAAGIAPLSTLRKSPISPSTSRGCSASAITSTTSTTR